MNEKLQALVRCPGGRLFSRWVGISRSQFWPPFSLEPFFERVRIDGTDDVAADAVCILDDERAFRRKTAVGSSIDVPQYSGIAVEVRRIPAGRPGLEANAIECVQVAWPVVAYLRHCPSGARAVSRGRTL